MEGRRCNSCGTDDAACLAEIRSVGVACCTACKITDTHTGDPDRNPAPAAPAAPELPQVVGTLAEVVAKLSDAVTALHTDLRPPPPPVGTEELIDFPNGIAIERLGDRLVLRVGQARAEIANPLLLLDGLRFAYRSLPIDGRLEGLS